MTLNNTVRTVPNNELLGEICALLAEGKRVKIRAKGDSMRPFIRGSVDIIVLAPTPTKLRKGDIVLAHTDDRGYVVHRIVGKKADALRLAGDGNLFGRETCRRCDVGGIAVALIRDGKERSLLSIGSRVTAFGWRLLLPLRRFKWLAINMIIND